MIINKFIKIVILISLFRANLMAGEATHWLNLKKITMMAALTGAGYFSWRLACKFLEKPEKKAANKAALEQEIITRVTEITGKNYQLTAKDHVIINSPKLKFVIFRSAKENFTWFNQQNPAEAVLKKPSGLMICDHNHNHQLWHSFGPNFNNETLKNVPAYTRTFDQNYEDISYSSFAEPEMIDLLSSQTSQCPAKQSALAKISGNSAFCKFKK